MIAAERNGEIRHENDGFEDMFRIARATLITFTRVGGFYDEAWFAGGSFLRAKYYYGVGEATHHNVPLRRGNLTKLSLRLD